MTRMFHWYFMWKMDSMSGCDIRLTLVFTLPPRDRTLQYKRCVHLRNNFPCIITLVMPDFQQYSWHLCSIKYELEIIFFVPLKCLFWFLAYNKRLRNWLKKHISIQKNDSIFHKFEQKGYRCKKFIFKNVRQRSEFDCIAMSSLNSNISCDKLYCVQL